MGVEKGDLFRAMALMSGGLAFQDDDQRAAPEGVSERVHGGRQHAGVECLAGWGDYRPDRHRVRCLRGLKADGEGLMGVSVCRLTCDYLGRKFAIIVTTAMIVVGGILATGGSEELGMRVRCWGVGADEAWGDSFEWAEY